MEVGAQVLDRLDADIVVKNGRVTTMGEELGHPAEVSAVAVRSGRVVAIGSDSDIESWLGRSTRVIDAQGRRVVPGLTDGHVHFVRAGLTWRDEVRWEGVESLEDGLELIRSGAAATSTDEWVKVVGGWDQNQFVERRGPSREELDVVAPGHPVFVQMNYDYAVLNTLGLATIGLDEESVDRSPVAEFFERDSRGRLTGRAFGTQALSWIYGQLPSPSFEEQVESTASLSEAYARMGLTAAIDGGGFNTGPEAYRPLVEVWKRGELRTRLRLFKHAAAPGSEREDFKGYLRYETPGFGDDLLRTSGFGEIISFRSHDSIERPADYSPEAISALRDLLEEFAAARWPVQMHVQRRELLDHLLTVFETIDAKYPLGELRWAIVHGDFLQKEDIPRLRSLGLGLSIQPHLRFIGESVLSALGENRVASLPELRDILDGGVPVALGSDATRVATYNPWANIEWFLTGKTLAGSQTLRAPHLLSRQEALYGYTAGPTWFTFEEDTRGKLVPGYYADLAILSKDFFEVETEEIPSIRSELTLVGGRVVLNTLEQ